MADIRNIRRNGDNTPDKICRCIGGNLHEIKRIYKSMSGQPVIVWDIEEEDFLIFKIKSDIETISLRNLEYICHEGLVFWGDGTSESYFSNQEFTHTYSVTSTEKEIKITAALEMLQDFSFDSMPITEIKIPSCITKIGSWAFQNSDIVRIEIPDSVSSVGNQMFQDCSSLEYCKLTENENYIAITNNMFYNAINLKKVKFCKNIKYLVQNCFSGCSALSEIDFNGTLAEWNSITKLSGWNSYCGQITVTCKDGIVIV